GMSPKSCLGCTKCFLFLLNLFFFVSGAGGGLGGQGGEGVHRAGGGLGGQGERGGSRTSEGRGEMRDYFGILLLLFAAQITVAIIVYTQRAALATKVATYAEELIRGYPAQGPPGDPHESWDAIQQQLGCCGWKGPQDWDHHDDATRDGTRDEDRAIACSCLRAPNSTLETPWVLPHGHCPVAAPQDIFPRGCKERVQTWLAGNLVTIVGVCIGISLGELSLLMLSMFLVRNLDSHYEKLLRGL
uniref:Tetraspanin n=1 Tax=Corvus moneduloides TaxID=1196302 RepID=A0A8U7NF24_CORMO